MKNIGIYLLLLCLCLIRLNNSSAQPYKLSAGLRLGSPVALSAKYFPNAKGAIEGFIGHRSYAETYSYYSYSWTMVGATYAAYKPINEVKGLQWFIGGGGAMFIWDWGENTALSRQYSTFSPGVVIHGGLDYRLENTPLNLSLDWMPVYSLSDYKTGFYAGYGAISVRYVLK